MAVYRLTEAAEADIVDILARSEAQFGSAARLRYERLIFTALIDVATDPVRPGSLVRPELGPDVRVGIFAAARNAPRVLTASSSDRGISSFIARLRPASLPSGVYCTMLWKSRAIFRGRAFGTDGRFRA